MRNARYLTIDYGAGVSRRFSRQMVRYLFRSWGIRYSEIELRERTREWAESLPIPFSIYHTAAGE